VYRLLMLGTMGFFLDMVSRDNVVVVIFGCANV
jgi:hypothetical protein